MTYFLNLLRRLFGIKIVAFHDNRAFEQQTYDLKHAQLARELGRHWKRGDRLNG